MTKTKRKTPGRRSLNRPCSTVPFHRANIDRRSNVPLVDGQIAQMKDGRQIEVWRIKDDPNGLCVRMFRPTLDGKVSKLMFGLHLDAAYGLIRCLERHLSNAGTERRRGKDQ